jgi:uncharacterized protein YjbI with pentapeptide repeats
VIDQATRLDGHSLWLGDQGNGCRLVADGETWAGVALNYLNLSRSSWAAACLLRAQLRHTRLRGCNLRGADLRKANLSYADLTGADLTGADLRGAALYRTNIARADMRGAVGLLEAVEITCLMGADTATLDPGIYNVLVLLGALDT